MTGTVVVTGLGRREGIAASVAAALAADGWSVFATWWRPYDRSLPWDSDDAEPDEVLAGIGGAGVEADLADPDVPAKVFDAAEAALGPVRALVNVHTHDPGRGGVLDVTAADLDEHLAVNVRGTFLLCQEFVRRYSHEAGPGRIVNFLSGPPLTGEIAYATTKGAVHWMSVALAGEVAARGITVNGIDPGPTDTGWMDDGVKAFLHDRMPLGRIGLPSDAANLVRFLLSDEGGWFTGQFLRSDGGFSALR